MPKVPRTPASTARPLEELTSITTPWPFVQWGLDLIGPFPVARGGAKFVMVVADYFMKSGEAEALASSTSRTITKFLWKSVICRFGIPQTFVSDNGKQFNCSTTENGVRNLG